MKTTAQEHQHNNSVDRLIRSIGLRESKKLLTKALPIIIARKNALIEAFEQNDRGTARTQAHKAAGSIRLYGSTRLEELLSEVSTLSSKQLISQKLHDELVHEFDVAISEIEERLKTDLS